MRTISAAAAVLCLGGVLRADDWPQWRGPQRDGVWNERGLLEKFPAGGLRIRWRAPVGPSYSSPAVAQGLVFVIDSKVGPWGKNEDVERVHCFDEATGRVVWTYSYAVAYPDWAHPPKGQQGPGATPIVDGGRLYTVGGNSHLHCFDAATGKILWMKDLAKEYNAAEFCVRGSPLIEGSFLIVPKGYVAAPGIIAFDKETGREVWTALEEGGYNSSPLVVTAGGTRQLILPCRNELVSMDPATGRIYWREKFECGIPTPVVSGNRLLVNGMMLALDPDKPAATIVWPRRKPDANLSDTTTALIQGDLILTHRKPDKLVCLDANNGKQLWDANVKSVMHSLTSTPNGVFILTDQGELILARIRAEGFQEISRSPLIKPTDPYNKIKVAWAAPSYANRHVFARNDEEIVCASLAADP